MVSNLIMPIKYFKDAIEEIEDPRQKAILRTELGKLKALYLMYERGEE